MTKPKYKEGTKPGEFFRKTQYTLPTPCPHKVKISILFNENDDRSEHSAKGFFNSKILEMPSLYLLPGLGFDDRVFQKLDLQPYQVNYLNWIEPHSGETLSAYALRIARLIPEQEEAIILIGHSFGGIIAQEIAALRRVKHIILLSSIKSPLENPWHFRVLHRLGLISLFTQKLIAATFTLWGKSSTDQSPEAGELMRDMVKQHSNHYLQWALQCLSSWKGAPEHHTSLTHLHGTRDASFPLRRIKKPVQLIHDGTHFMVFKQAETISARILKILEEL